MVKNKSSTMSLRDSIAPNAVAPVANIQQSSAKVDEAPQRPPKSLSTVQDESPRPEICGTAQTERLTHQALNSQDFPIRNADLYCQPYYQTSQYNRFSGYPPPAPPQFPELGCSRFGQPQYRSYAPERSPAQVSSASTMSPPLPDVYRSCLYPTAGSDYASNVQGFQHPAALLHYKRASGAEVIMEDTQVKSTPSIEENRQSMYEKYQETLMRHAEQERTLSANPPDQSPVENHELELLRQAKQEQHSRTMFEKYKETIGQIAKSRESNITKALGGENLLKSPEAYTRPFCDFMTENVTVFHAVDFFEKKLTKAGFKKLSERQTWNDELVAGGKYYTTRNGSSLIAFAVGDAYKSGNGVAMIAGHIDALTARLKPVSAKKTTAGYLQLGVAPYAGALNTTWWDRDLGIAGRVLVKDGSGKIVTRLVKLDWPIARIPTLAPHFGVGMLGTNNAETQAVPIIGLDNSDIGAMGDEFKNLTLGGAGSFAATQPPKLVRAIAGELSIQDYSSIVNWELELFDTQPAQVGGLDKEFIFAGRIDDKICSWAAIEGLLASVATPKKNEGIIKLVGLFDDEEIGSQLRRGAKSNFLPSVVERISEAFSKNGSSANTLSQTYANSFLVSADVSHAVNPNFLGSYLEGHAPRLNVGLVIASDSNGHMTTDSVSTALLTRCAEKSDNKLQVFQIRNDSRSGGTVGPMLSSAMGVRSIDAGIPQLSMHSIRATVGNLDPGLGVKIFKGFLDHFEEVDKEFE